MKIYGKQECHWQYVAGTKATCIYCHQNKYLWNYSLVFKGQNFKYRLSDAYDIPIPSGAVYSTQLIMKES